MQLRHAMPVTMRPALASRFGPMLPAACPAEATIADFIAGQLPSESVARVEQHLDGCKVCFRLLTELARTTVNEKGAPAAAEIAHEVPRTIDEYCLLRR